MTAATMVVALGTEVVICTDPEAVATQEVVAASPAALQPRSYQLELFEYACKQNVRITIPSVPFDPNVVPAACLPADEGTPDTNVSCTMTKPTCVECSTWIACLWCTILSRRIEAQLSQLTPPDSDNFCVCHVDGGSRRVASPIEHPTGFLTHFSPTEERPQ